MIKKNSKKLIILLLIINNIYSSQKNRFSHCVGLNIKYLLSLKSNGYKTIQKILQKIDFVNKNNGSKSITVSPSSPAMRKRESCFTQKNQLLHSIPIRLFRNKKNFLKIWLAWRKSYFFINGQYAPKLTTREKTFFQKYIFNQKYIIFSIFKKELYYRKKIVAPKELNVASGFFYSNNATAFDCMFYIRYLSNINTFFFSFIAKYPDILLHVSFESLLKMYAALALSHAFDNPDTGNNNKSFQKKIRYKIIETIIKKINHMKENNLYLTQTSLLYKVAYFQYLEDHETNNTTQIQLTKSIKNFICSHLQRKKFYINSISIKELSQDDSELKTWTKQLIAILEKNIKIINEKKFLLIRFKAPLICYTNNPYTFNIKPSTEYDYCNENEYNQIKKTKLIIEKLKKFCNVFKVPSFMIFNQSDLRYS